MSCPTCGSLKNDFILCLVGFFFFIIGFLPLFNFSKPFFLGVRHVLILLRGPQSRSGDKLLRIGLACPQNETAVLSGLRSLGENMHPFPRPPPQHDSLTRSHMNTHSLQERYLYSAGMHRPTIPALYIAPTGTNYSAHRVPHWLIIPSVPSDLAGTIYSGQPAP